MSTKRTTYGLIWEAVRQIPKGKVASYSDVAALCGLVGKQRLVGYALHNLPRNSGVPWHRVVNAQGKISLPKNTGGYARQKRALKKEGIVFTRETIDLGKFGVMQTIDAQ